MSTAPFAGNTKTSPASQTTGAEQPGTAVAPGGKILPDDLSFGTIIEKPLIIDRQEKHSWLDIIRTADRTAAVELLADLCRLSNASINVRWAGGCKGFTPEMVEKLFAYIARGSISPDGMRSFQGAVGSGGTMDFNKDGSESLMICQVPYYLARLMPCIAWGSTPQTYRLRTDAANGGVIVSKYGAKLDPRGHMNVLTQDDATHFQGWNGDVRWYIEALQSFEKRGYKVAVGVVNGGDVTMDEALLALSKGIPVIVVDGTGRTADILAKAASSEDVAAEFRALYTEAFRRDLLEPSKDEIPTEEKLKGLLRVVSFENPLELSLAMDTLGLLTEIPRG